MITNLSYNVTYKEGCSDLMVYDYHNYVLRNPNSEADTDNGRTSPCKLLVEAKNVIEIAVGYNRSFILNSLGEIYQFGDYVHIPTRTHNICHF